MKAVGISTHNTSGVYPASDRSAGARLPGFIAVGPPRTGTTWLYRALNGYVGLPRGTKETDFFSINYSKGLEWYLEFFRDCAPDLPIGEISPNYFADDAAADRISAQIPGCRIVCTLRDPVDRLYSFYRLMRHNGWTGKTFEDVVESYPPAVDSNRYAYHIRRWWKLFGRERVLVALYDDLEDDSQRFLNAICDFIGIRSIRLDGSPLMNRHVNSVTRGPRFVSLAHHSWRLRQWLDARGAETTITLLRKIGLWRFSFRGGGEFGPLDPEVDRRLRERFRPEVEALEALIGRELSAWTRPHPAAHVANGD